jgi:hypothetical protein
LDRASPHLLRQIVNRDAIDIGAARRLELQAGFHLFGGGRFQRVPSAPGSIAGVIAWL